MNRFQMVLVAIIIFFISPFINLLMILQALDGSPTRAHNMELAFDCLCNALFGGDPTISISERTGNGVIMGYKWAIKLAPIIDFFFGKNHCANNATTIIPTQK